MLCVRSACKNDCEVRNAVGGFGRRLENVDVDVDVGGSWWVMVGGGWWVGLRIVGWLGWESEGWGGSARGWSGLSGGGSC